MNLNLSQLKGVSVSSPVCAAILHFHPRVSAETGRQLSDDVFKTGVTDSYSTHTHTHMTQVYLCADPRCGLTQSQYRDVLGSVQPVDGQFGAGGPLHHGHVVLTDKQSSDTTINPSAKQQHQWVKDRNIENKATSESANTLP